ncbi:hypothetical protein niasHT_028955 [Heterodera trifolii]|uniref:Gustatory receptor n=1 Tax=Heterodera trifolii TaxID=157864 RepID=A0ABD2K1Z3_9BILA
MTSTSVTIDIFAYIFSFFELFIYGIVLAIAFLNLAVICPTKILHINLKSILISHSVALIVYIIGRAGVIAEKFLSNDQFVSTNVVLRNVMAFVGFFRLLIGHVLIIERFIATMRSNSYETIPKRVFICTWLSITLSIALINTIIKQWSGTFTQFNLINSSISTILSLLEYLMIVIIGYYNQRIYNRQIEKAAANNYHIGQRYQVSNNMKTAKQLKPAFLCFFLSNIPINLMQLLLKFHLLNEQYQISLAFSLNSLIHGILSAVIELTIMTHHPFLKRRFLMLLKKIFRLKRNQIGEAQPNAEALATVAKNGAFEMTDHFNILQQLWNK